VRRAQRLGDFAFTGDSWSPRQGAATLLEMLNAMTDSVPAEARPMICADVMAALVVLMTV
jgi:hypothetical protein